MFDISFSELLLVVVVAFLVLKPGDFLEIINKIRFLSQNFTVEKNHKTTSSNDYSYKDWNRNCNQNKYLDDQKKK